MNYPSSNSGITVTAIVVGIHLGGRINKNIQTYLQTSGCSQVSSEFRSHCELIRYSTHMVLSLIGLH